MFDQKRRSRKKDGSPRKVRSDKGKKRRPKNVLGCAALPMLIGVMAVAVAKGHGR
jgi:uncharacterized membrane protein